MRVLITGLFIAYILASATGQYTEASCDDKTVIVHLFEWKWTDVAAECERFLSDHGFCAVQVSPPQEHEVLSEDGYPWYQRYRPVSYLLNSRSGSEAEFIDMVQRCNAVGVRIIVDAVLNNMAEVGITGTGSGGSSFDAAALSFPSVPYSSADFTPGNLCPSSDGQVHDYQNVDEVRNCYLTGLTDLYQSQVYVQQKIVDYLNRLIDIGVMGFRVDAAKHMWPEDLQIIQDLTNDLSTTAGFSAGSRPFFYHEVYDYGFEPITVADYYALGRVTEFRYTNNIQSGMNDYTQLGSLYIPANGMTDPGNAFIFVDNHNSQRGGGTLSYKDGTIYSNAVVFTLAQDYGFARIMSSYDFTDNNQGPPSVEGVTDDVIINTDESCGGGWICEHRWTSISRMIQFRNAVGNVPMENLYSDGDTFAFSRGSAGFFVINKNGLLNQNFQTGLAAGDYCDVITNCATTVTVSADGTADISINSVGDPFVAICQGCGMI